MDKYEQVYGPGGEYADHLSPVSGGRYTDVMHPPPGEEDNVAPLHTQVTTEPQVSPDGESARVLVIVNSGWQPHPEQLAQLQAGAHVRLTLWTYPPPPVSLAIEPPIGDNGEPMRWEPDHGAGSYVESAPPDRPVSESGHHDAAEQQVRDDFRPAD